MAHDRDWSDAVESMPDASRFGQEHLIMFWFGVTVGLMAGVFMGALIAWVLS